EVPPDRGQATGVTQVELDEHGNLRVRVDPRAFRARRALRRQLQVPDDDRSDVALSLVCHGPPHSWYLYRAGTPAGKYASWSQSRVKWRRASSGSGTCSGITSRSAAAA